MVRTLLILFALLLANGTALADWPSNDSVLFRPKMLADYVGKPFDAVRAALFTDCHEDTRYECVNYRVWVEATPELSFLIPERKARIAVELDDDAGRVNYIGWRVWMLNSKPPISVKLARRIQASLPCDASERKRTKDGYRTLTDIDCARDGRRYRGQFRYINGHLARVQVSVSTLDAADGTYFY
jgi:hypothetical protein